MEAEAQAGERTVSVQCLSYSTYQDSFGRFRRRLHGAVLCHGGERGVRWVFAQLTSMELCPHGPLVGNSIEALGMQSRSYF